jgi:Uma2 family endonuclease
MPPSGRAAHPATYDDLARVPDHFVAEIVGGELHVTPRPALRHALAASSLGDELVAPFQKGRGGPGGWWILDEPELHLASDVVVPDLAAWQRGRLANVPDEPFLTLRPDWIAEILSPSTARLDRVHKLSIYAREQVPHVWLLDPAAMTMEVLALERARWIVLATHGAGERVRAVPFEAIEIDLAQIWGTTDQSPP